MRGSRRGAGSRGNTARGHDQHRRQCGHESSPHPAHPPEDRQISERSQSRARPGGREAARQPHPPPLSHQPAAAGHFGCGTGRLVQGPALEHFLTARWGMHNAFFGRPVYLPNTHPRRPLYRADLLHGEDDLVTAAGLPPPLESRLSRPRRPRATLGPCSTGVLINS
ncbi:DUF2071 domain-containing protein [Streptomyces angustmyceticus]|uniref:DUF2071 domain-containing protein n=1 Tax=Streptomyces angustmyceticus TaxID=285578 RepID=UPI00369CF530